MAIVERDALDLLADDGLHVGNRLIASNDEVYAALEKAYGSPMPPSAA